MLSSADWYPPSIDTLNWYSWVIPSLNTLDQLSMETLLTLNCCLCQHLIDTWSISQLTVGWESTNFSRHAIECWSILMSQWKLRRLLIKILIKCRSRCWLSVNQGVDWVSIKVLVECCSSCWSSVDWGWIEGRSRVDWGCHLTLMPIVHRSYWSTYNSIIYWMKA